ncbi:NAD(P)-binding domain-containing protein [Thermodesulfobacterium hydrogeniphilum]|uniref:NAD(P)-binding domain-containing protein n=1 Tax=Thermodesulfobacterium hydrogeniphilum TaxID=161156 RepID=UPI00056EF889|nr:NAD(P)-binding domain-containing protein [Thermodesulfobacterium hydrogeniphilum]
MEKVKIAIIGAGPAGIASAIEAKASKIEPVVILEKSDQICYTINKFYKPGKRVDANFKSAGIKPIGLCSFETETKENFLKRIENWTKQWNLDIRFKAEVTNITKNGEGYDIWIKDNPEIWAEFVIIAIGIFGTPRKPSYPIPSELKNKIFFEPPQQQFENKKILVVGGGNTAAEVAYSLCDNNEIYISYRRPQFFRINETNLKILNEKAKQGKIKLLLNTDIEKLEPFDDKIKVYFKNNKEDIYDYIIYCLGGSTPKRFLQKIGIQMDNKKPSLDEYFETNLPKVFLVGDIAVEKGNIMKAFNTAHIVIKRIKEKYLK